MEKPKAAIDRRTFVAGAGGMMLAAGVSAKSYSRILGANDRIRLGQLGCGSRSQGHVHMVQLAAKQMLVETIAVCDIWSLARDQGPSKLRVPLTWTLRNINTLKKCWRIRTLMG